jgi:hypothetical protein
MDVVVQQLDQKLDRGLKDIGGQVRPQPFYSCVPTGVHGPTCILWADLTASSLQ